MCLSADEVNPLCDECVARYKRLSVNRELEVCEECKKFLEHYCECCMTYKKDEIIKDGCCRQCSEQ